MVNIPIIFLVVLLLSSFTATHAMSTVNCAVFGVGVLGTSLCRQILEAFPDMQVTGITKTKNRHDEIWDQVGRQYDGRFRLCTDDEVNEKCDNVVFCAPPSGFEDYAGAVQRVIENVWSGPQNGGMFIFTSSGGMYVLNVEMKILLIQQPTMTHLFLFPVGIYLFTDTGQEIDNRSPKTHRLLILKKILA